MFDLIIEFKSQLKNFKQFLNYKLWISKKIASEKPLNKNLIGMIEYRELPQIKFSKNISARTCISLKNNILI